jgi:hypothetical protein
MSKRLSKPRDASALVASIVDEIVALLVSIDPLRAIGNGFAVDNAGV